MKQPPVHTRRYHKMELERLKKGEVVVAAPAYPEERYQGSLWQKMRLEAPQQVVSISEHTRDEIKIDGIGDTVTISLTDEEKLQEFFSFPDMLLDISSLPHHVWAPIFRVRRKFGQRLRVLYVEPADYKSHPSPASANLFDLSVSFDGLGPLPGFSKLDGPDEGQPSLLVIFLGFEGNRAERMINQIEPPPKVIPIIGAPGFQINYPAITVACNKGFLSEFDCNSEIRFARASCPFEAVDVVNSLRRSYPEHYFYLAPLGTRPHALGAIQYAINNSDHCEILFDHPVRQTNRTSGQGLIHIYEFQ